MFIELLKDNQTPNSQLGIALFRINKVQVANAIDLSKRNVKQLWTWTINLNMTKEYDQELGGGTATPAGAWLKLTIWQTCSFIKEQLANGEVLL